MTHLAAVSKGRVFRPDKANELEAFVSAQMARRVEHPVQPLWRWWGVRKMGGLP